MLVICFCPNFWLNGREVGPECYSLGLKVQGCYKDVFGHCFGRKLYFFVDC